MDFQNWGQRATDYCDGRLEATAVMECLTNALRMQWNGKMRKLAFEKNTLEVRKREVAGTKESAAVDAKIAEVEEQLHELRDCLANVGRKVLESIPGWDSTLN